jgi:PIN domain nuclease of toxin-antitoxin system
MADPRNEIFVSAASAWEIATKVRLGKLRGAEDLERDFLETMEASGYTLMSIDAESALRAGRLIEDHGDPFDRMIAAHALRWTYLSSARTRSWTCSVFAAFGRPGQLSAHQRLKLRMF